MINLNVQKDEYLLIKLSKTLRYRKNTLILHFENINA